MTINDTYVCDQFTAHGSAGAAYIGVCGNPVETVTLTCVSGVDFAIGEFGIEWGIPGGACCDEAAGNCTDGVWASDCVGLRFKVYATCDELNPPCGQIWQPWSADVCSIWVDWNHVGDGDRVLHARNDQRVQIVV